jgi:tetratricopeptide (TPR) repeat protein
VAVDRDQLINQYEATGREEAFLEAKELYERALAESPDDAELHLKYGYLLECHARNQLRQAVAEYERAIELNPDGSKAHYQLIGARAGLLEPEIPISTYERRLAGSPKDLDSHRLLATAYLAAHQYDNARRVIDAGLALAPADAALIESRGEVRAGTGDPGGALDDWRRALELNPENLSSVYSTAFLLERQGRLGEAMEAWRYIIDWSDARGFSRDAEWPKQELERLRGGAAQTTGEART